MKMSPAKLAAAAALVGFLGVGSAQLANAQDDPSTTSTVEESTTEDTVTDDSATDDSATDDSATDDGTARDEDCPKDAEAPADTSTQAS